MSPPWPWPLSRRIAKRALDVALSSLGLGLCALPLSSLAIAVRATTPGPALFVQQRMGRGGKPFSIYKLRTMTWTGGPRPNASDEGGAGATITASGDPRITPLGRVLRRTKLDELPQLWNVLRGDMSLVGPRPEVPRYRSHYQGARSIVLSVRPGITDPASLAFRDEERVLAGYPTDEDRERGYAREVLPRKLALSARYVREQSLAGDLSLLVRTAAAVLVGA